MRFLFPLLTLAAFGCNNAQTATSSAHVPGELERSGQVIATVNGVNVTQSMLDAVLSTIPDEVRAQMEASGQVAQLKDQIITQEVLYQEALKEKLHEQPEVQTRLALAERDALIESLLRKVVDERSTDEALKAWYTDHLVQFRKEQVSASHILVETEDEAKEVLAEVKKEGADFGAIAKERSKDPSAKQNGGDLGWFEKGRMVKEFADAAFAAEEGEIVGPVKSQFGYHIILVQGKRDVVPFEEVKDDIKSKAQQEIAQKYVEELKEAALNGGGAEAEAAPTSEGAGEAH